MGPEPTTRRALAGLDLGAADGVGADGEELDHGRITQRNAGRRIDVDGGQDDLFGHAAGSVDAEYLQRFAAVELAFEAGRAMAAVEVGVDDHRRAHRELGAIGIGDGAAQLVADDAGVFEVGEGAFEDMIVGAADADMADGDAHPTRLQHRRRDIDQGQLLGGGAGYGAQDRISSSRRMAMGRN